MFTYLLLDPKIANHVCFTCLYSDPKIELRIAACSNTNIAIGRKYQSESPVPNLKIHSIRACHFYNGDVQSLNFQNKTWNTPGSEQKALKMAEQLVIDEVLHSHDPRFDVDHLKAIWYPLGRKSLLEFYANQFIKHSHHTELVWIDNFFYTAAQLCLPILSFNNRTDLRIFLYANGFETNKYHKVSDLIEALRVYFRVYAMPIFTLDGPHVCFRESSVIYNLGDKSAVDHPRAMLLAKTMAASPISYEFLMRRM